jgi:hypothetical protein
MFFRFRQFLVEKRHEYNMRNIAILKTKEKYKEAEAKEIRRIVKKPARAKIPTSKKFFIAVLALAIEIIAYSELAMWVFHDTVSLATLIGIPAALLTTSAGLISYNKKSMAENTEGGVVYDSMMKSYSDTQNIEENGEEVNDL